jgi:hypothetical protein
MPFITTSVGGDGSGLPGPQGEPGNDGLNGAGFDPQPLVKSNLDPTIGSSMTLIGPDNPFTGAWSVGSYVRVINSVNTEEFFEGTITDFTSGGLTVTILISYVTETWTREGNSDVWTMILAGERGSGSAADTGQITFNGVYIMGAGTGSGDGAGNGTIKLLPDVALVQNQYHEDQYLIIDPTSPNHIHIRAGGVQDASTADLFIGAERTGVQVSDGSGNVIIRSKNPDRVDIYANSNQASNTEFMVATGANILVGDTVHLYTGGDNFVVTAVTQEYPYAGLMTVVADGLSFVTGESYTFSRNMGEDRWLFDENGITFPNNTVQTDAFEGGATGTFETPDSKLVTVTNGIITSIDPLD